MTIRRNVVIAATIVACVAQSAEAVQLNLSCGTAASAILGTDDTVKGLVVGAMVGATGMIADLLCFVGDRRCGCLRNSTESTHPRNDQWVDQTGTILASCALGPNSGRSLSGIAQEAALAICR